MDDPRIVNSFLQIRKKLMIKDDLLSRLKLLNDNILDTTITNLQQQELEVLDNLRVTHILQADQKCRKLKMGNVPWSPTLQASINRIRYFRACVSRSQQHKVNSRTLEKLFLATDLDTKLTI
jgi:hypothetical protein